MPGDGAAIGRLMVPAMPGDEVRGLREQGDCGECREDGEDDDVGQDRAGRDHRLKSSKLSPVGAPKEPKPVSLPAGSGSWAVVFGRCVSTDAVGGSGVAGGADCGVATGD